MSMMDDPEHVLDCQSNDDESILESNVETLLDESVSDDMPIEQDVAAVPHEDVVVDETIGPEEATKSNRFAVHKLLYRGQTHGPEVCSWTIRSDTPAQFLQYLFELIQPHIRRAIEFQSPNEPVWSQKMTPTKEDLPIYVAFKDHISKRTYQVKDVEEFRLQGWAHKTITLQLYIYSNHVISRPAYEIAKQQLLISPLEETIPSKKVVREISTEQKLPSLTKRLEKIHLHRLVPNTVDAFGKWARFILQAPIRQQSELCYAPPPDHLLQYFAERQNQTYQALKGSTQRKRTSDGLGFEDEVYALRQTVTQIKDLVETLDRRVGLLEKRCHEFRRIMQEKPCPSKRPKWPDGNEANSSDDEPVIDESLGSFEGHNVKTDPLLSNGRYKIKQERFNRDA
ncbi:uncharacterized protein LOC131432417 [Malaya genurostris]|uniref:uncharacterized protein LOC131432417 n=1 Tax=Malaya genurostris TaxID=325434 RepID=UPI0026F40106|nr:uncharacterized protein LOC131432417 [Malaya genurostris]